MVGCREASYCGGELLPRGIGQIDVERAGEPDKIYEYVRHLLGCASVQRIARCHGGGLVTREPLEEFGEFTYLADQGEDQRLRVVELIPVALVDERAERFTQFCEVRHASSMS